MLTSFTSSFTLALHLLWREVRRGQWTIVLLALILAVTATTGFYFYTERLALALDKQSAILLGGDLVVSSPSPIPSTWTQKLHSLQLKTAEVWLYPSVVSAQDRFHLVNIQAVDKKYPLIGTPLELKPGHVIVDSRLLTILAININDEIQIGAKKFKVQKTLPVDLDVLNTGWMIAPKVIMLLSDIPATQTVVPGSRVDYRILVAGNHAQIISFRNWVRPLLLPGQRVLGIKDQQYVSRNYLERAQNFIQLVLLFCLLMSGIAIGLSIREYLRNHYTYIALWRCLGAQANQITSLFIWQLIIISVIAGIIGVCLGYALQQLIANVINYFINFPLPPAGITPILFGFTTSILLLFCYAYPLISMLPRTPPLYLWREQILIPRTQQTIYLVVAIVFLLAYIYWAMNFSILALFFLDVLLLSIGFLFLLSLFILSLLRKVSALTNGSVYRGINQLTHYPESFGTQLTAFALILMSILTIAFVRNDIVSNWQQALRTNAPNYFAFNIAPSDLPSVERIFSVNKIAVEGIYSMVRGRITAMNGKPIMQAIPPQSRGHNALHRELNLSEMVTYPSDNRIIKGNAWTENDNARPLISIESDLANALHAQIGDQLTFQIGDQTITAVVSNVRTVDWGSLHPNFYIIFPPGILNNYPTTFITSFHLQETQTFVLKQLLSAFPNVTIIDIAVILQRLQDLFAKLELVLRYLFLSAAISAVLIFITSLLASIDERRMTYSLLRKLGANKGYIQNSIITEFLILTIATISIAVILAKVISYLLMKSLI